MVVVMMMIGESKVKVNREKVLRQGNNNAKNCVLENARKRLIRGQRPDQKGKQKGF